MYVPLKTTVPHGLNVPSVPSPWHTTHGGPEWFQEHSSERTPRHHFISPFENSRWDLCVLWCFSEYLQGLGRAPPARSYPIYSMCVPPGGSVGPSSFSHLPEHSASDGDTAKIILKANPVPWSTSIETKLLFWKLPPQPAEKNHSPLERRISWLASGARPSLTSAILWYDSNLPSWRAVCCVNCMRFFVLGSYVYFIAIFTKGLSK